MPISELEKELLDLVKSLRDLNFVFIDYLMRRDCSSSSSVTSDAAASEEEEYIGKLPWFRAQSRFEKKFSKHKLFTISGIPEKEESDADGIS